MAYIERREIEGSDLQSGGLSSGVLGPNSVISGIIASGAIGVSTIFGSGAIQSGALGAASIVSGNLNSGAVTDVQLYKASFPTTTYITGNFSWSGVSAGTSGVAIVSGSFQPTATGKVLVQATAVIQGVAGGTTGNEVTIALVSGPTIALSGIGVPAQEIVIIGGITSGAIGYGNFALNTLQTMPLNVSGNWALIMGPGGSGLVSGTGTIIISELIN